LGTTVKIKHNNVHRMIVFSHRKHRTEHIWIIIPFFEKKFRRNDRY